MKLVKANLLSDVVGSYDQTKTTIQGRVSQKTISGADYLGPPQTKFANVFGDTGLTPSGPIYETENNRIFVTFLVVAGTYGVALYDHDPMTNMTTYVGQMRFSIPNSAATTHTPRSFKVIDNAGTTGWKVVLVTTGTVTINGGTFLVNKVDRADFLAVPGPAIPFATGNDLKAVYFLQDPSNIGVGQLQIAAAGAAYESTSSRLYVHNGIAATHQYYLYDMSIAPTYTTTAVSVSVASPGIVSDAGHSYVNNTPVVFTAGTLPTGLTVGTTYFVKNAVAGVSYELSATSGGASINTTGSPSAGAFIGRAFGTTGSNFVHKTGNLPALTGTLILLDSEDHAIPAHSANSGQSCVFFATTTNLYLGRLSDLTSGTTLWPNLVTSNITGTTNQITAPTLTLATWSNALDAAIYTTNGTKFIVKQVVNNVIQQNFGRLNNIYYEGFTLPEATASGLITISGLDVQMGFLMYTGTTVGQRGFTVLDLRSDSSYDYSYIVTPVLETPSAIYNVVSSIQSKQAYETGDIIVDYRTSGFGSISGGWISCPASTDISSLAAGSQVQFKIRFQMTSQSYSTPTQINELFLGITSLSEISDNWEFSDDNSDNNTPSRVAFRLKQAYSSSVPTLYFRAYDLSNALLINNNTVTNSSNFEYSTDSGMTWLPLGTIPNTIGTLLRYTFTSPPGVDIRPGLRES
jgi:hypothetical protein